LDGCKTWSIRLGEEHGLTRLENGFLRKIFCLEREEAAGVLRKLHNWKLHHLYSLSNVIRMINSRRMDGHDMKDA
jgi:hypothetical protein